MKKFFKTKEGFAVFSLILSALIGVLMGIWVRLMAHHFGNFQQIALRATIGGLLGLVIYSFTKKIKVKTFMNIMKIQNSVDSIVRKMVVIFCVVFILWAIITSVEITFFYN